LRQWWGCPCSWSTQGSSCLFPPLFQPSYFFNRYLPVFVCEKERSDAREKAGREKDAASLVLDKKFMWSLMRGTARTKKEGPDVGIYGAQCSRPPTKSRVEYTKSMALFSSQGTAQCNQLSAHCQGADEAPLHHSKHCITTVDLKCIAAVCGNTWTTRSRIDQACSVMWYSGLVYRSPKI
jgi:hypothetical protein